MKNISKIANEIIKESLNISKGRFFSFITDAIAHLNLLLKSKSNSKFDGIILTQYNTAKSYFDEAGKCFIDKKIQESLNVPKGSFFSLITDTITHLNLLLKSKSNPELNSAILKQYNIAKSYFDKAGKYLIDKNEN